MRSTVGRMTLRELLIQYRIPTIREFARRMDFSRQQAWDLWHARVGVGAAMMKRLHEELHIPLEALIQLDPVPWQKQPKREDPGRKPKGPPKKPTQGKGRPQR
jgi:transcriptional regulator with XRE-family HTH domain